MAKLLYVEDDQINALVVTKFLEKEHVVTIATSTSEALDRVKNDQFDLILMDISLGNGDEDGTWLLHQIKSIPGYKEIKVVALTAHALIDDRQKFLSEGFDSYLSKPINKENLSLHIADLLVNQVPS